MWPGPWGYIQGYSADSTTSNILWLHVIMCVGTVIYHSKNTLPIEPCIVQCELLIIIQSMQLFMISSQPHSQTWGESG